CSPNHDEESTFRGRPFRGRHPRGVSGPVARRHGGIEELAMRTAVRRCTSPLVLWPAGAFGVFMLGAWLGAVGAWMTPGAQLDPTNSIGTAVDIFLHNLVVLALI